ncbi:MAG: SDR family oxidoreductase [Gammaproteobacteria bacterium]|nr:SDR family oxidoreductase [Gammaproteobacteria bacterium]
MNKWALVTGASSGIGAELARVYAQNHHNVIVVARREDKLTILADELRLKGVEVHVIAMDLATKKSPRRLFSAVQDLDVHVDVLVNNAGFTHHGPFVEMNSSEVIDMVQLNMSTLAALSHHFAGPMVAAGEGRILNVASITAFQPVPGFALYAAGKAFVLSFTEALSEELKGTGVSVTVLCPGLTDTEMVDNVQDDNALPSIPGFLISDAKGVAQEGYDAAKGQEVVRIPGLANQMTTLWVQSQPRWLVRSLGGLFGRQFMK